MFFIGQDIGRKGKMTLDEHRHETLLPESADQAIEGHRGDIEEGRTPFEAKTAVGGNQGLASDIGTHTAIAQNEVG